MRTNDLQFKWSSDLTLWFAFAAVYVLWGSTYLALRFALESIPPFLMASSRFMIAGSIMLFIAKLDKQPWPTKEEIKNSAIIGFLLLVIANGGVVWAEQYIDSGITALIVTIEPVWVVMLMWMRNRKHKPTLVVWMGILLGLSGMFVLVGPSALGSVKKLNPVGVAVLIVSSISWAVGSVYALRIKLPSSSSMSTGFQMFAAGICLMMIGSIRSEWTGFEFSEITTNSLLGFSYLVIFGSLVGFTSYSYIVKRASPTSVSTYAYVNPIIAVFLGWWIGNEEMGTQTLFAALLLVSAVVLIITKPAVPLLGCVKIMKNYIIGER